MPLHRAVEGLRSGGPSWEPLLQHRGGAQGAPTAPLREHGACTDPLQMLRRLKTPLSDVQDTHPPSAIPGAATAPLSDTQGTLSPPLRGVGHPQTPLSDIWGTPNLPRDTWGTLSTALSSLE